MRISSVIHTSILLSAFALAGMVGPAESSAQADPPTYRVILYLAEQDAPSEVQVRRLDEVWSVGDSAERLQSLLSSGSVQQLEEVTMVPGQDTPAIQFGEVTFRVEGVLKEPHRDSVFLRLEVDGGREAVVKEMLASFDETIILAYPLAEGDRSVVALLVPVP
ncbi:MAG: hypothetical protein ACREMD_01705 [Gemmatimonadota bacterium]